MKKESPLLHRVVTCPVDGNVLLAHIEEDDKNFNKVIELMKGALKDDVELKAQILRKQVY